MHSGRCDKAGLGISARGHLVPRRVQSHEKARRLARCAAAVAPLLSLRSATTADVRVIYSIFQECGQSWSLELVQSALENHNASVELAVEAGDVSAVLVCLTVADEVHVEMVATRPNCQRRGMASLLLSTMLARFGDQCTYFLEVSRTNERVLRLYQNVGFHVYHERKSYYQDGSDALLMTRPAQV
eukprot:jgi/Ulvmu1/5228/UM022_0021.1